MSPRRALAAAGVAGQLLLVGVVRPHALAVMQMIALRRDTRRAAAAAMGAVAEDEVWWPGDRVRVAPQVSSPRAEGVGGDGELSAKLTQRLGALRLARRKLLVAQEKMCPPLDSKR